MSKESWSNVFEYSNGKLLWKTRQGSRAIAGRVAGCLSDQGYIVVKYSGLRYFAHRIIYEMHYGQIKDGFQVDHINRVRDDNRIENLRIVTRQENQWNRKGKGYYWKKRSKNGVHKFKLMVF